LKKKLHILFLCGWYPSSVLPQNGDFIMRHAQSVHLKHNVSILHIITKSDISKTEIKVIKEGDLFTYIAYVPQSSNPIIKLIRFWNAYKKILGKIGSFDVVHLNKLYPFGLFALHLKKFKHIPYIISEHWTGYHLKGKKSLPCLERFLSKKITKNASSVCPVSKDLKKSMLKCGLKGSYKIIPNVVNTHLFKPAKKTTKKFTITHISSLLDKHKNITGMLRVAKQLEKSIDAFQWKFIGGKKDQFSALLNELNFKKNTIHFIDQLSHEQIPKQLIQSDVFVLFSNYENLPCVILEAFACGIPVISTNVGGIQEFFPKNFGFLIEPNNEDQLFQKLIEIFNNPFSRSIIMHQYANDNFSSEIICDSFSKLYIKAINK
jgi:glycosyltransferase involved in cell wall biosynthesis